MKDIVPLAYELKKAVGIQVNADTIYNGITKAYTGGNIGVISNQITQCWNANEISEDAINSVKWLCYITNQTIDCAKTLWKDPVPKEVSEIIRSFTKAKMPHFFIEAKDKTEEQVEPTNNSTMNRIANSFPQKTRIKFCKTIDKFDYRMLMNKNESFTIEDDNPIIKEYDYWIKKQNVYVDGQEHKDDIYIYDCIRKTFETKFCKFGINFVVNTLVAFMYTLRESSSKKLLWSCFGDIIVKNLEINTKNLGNICPICGKRFKSHEHGDSVYCSEKCMKEGSRVRAREFKEK